jgi:chitin elicitor receptor kinase 1
MTWSTRLQISLDVARGLEYIHDHSVPVYIHRDIKSENILLNENLTGKVLVYDSIFFEIFLVLSIFFHDVDHILFILQIADFGLTKLTDIASSTDNTDHVAGTFGYMPPEYDQFFFTFYVVISILNLGLSLRI